MTEKLGGDAEAVPNHYYTVESGSMSECVTMFVLWDWGKPTWVVDDAEMVWPKEYYRKMRGFHGSGAFEHINLQSLFDGVPNNRDTRVFVCLGTSSGVNRNEINRVKTAGREDDRWNETTRKMAAGGNFRVNRLGELSIV